MRGGRPVQLIVMVLLACRGAVETFADWADCPSPCQCKWSSGKKTALCRDAGLVEVPTNLDGDMQVLDLSANGIGSLPADAFKRVGLLNLQRVFLRGCGIRDVHRDAFRELKILVELDLSDNLIGTLHPDTFHGNERLRVLYLNGNPLTELGEAQFPVLQHLRTLELQHCQIKRVHRDAFLHVTALESLNLNGNMLRWLSETVFLPVSRLKTLSLDGNPWLCDCRLRGFRNWYVASNLYAHPLSCIEPPALSGSRWENVEPAEFACPPAVHIDRRTGGGGVGPEDAGGNVSFTCKVTGDPVPEVSWYFNGHSVDNYTGRMEENRTSWPDDGRVWSALSVYNVSDAVAGEFTCEARNSRGRTSANVSLALPEVAVATTLGKSRSVYVVVGCAAAGVAALLLAAAVTCCACRAGKSRSSSSSSSGGGGGVGCAGRRDAKGDFKGSGSFSEADKRLLDASISTTQAGSCEMLQNSGQDLELMEHQHQHQHQLQLQQQNVVPLASVCGGDQQPVHITIESHDHHLQPLHRHHMHHHMGYPPPPAEFSTGGGGVQPSVGVGGGGGGGGGYGNIFISVSVSQEPPPDASESRYPDLLDMKHRSQVSVGTGTSAPPHRHLQQQQQHHHHHHHMQQQQQQQQQRAPPSSYYATMPRNRLKDQSAVKSVPHYDNMGPRITAAGSCTNLSSLSNSGGSSDDIPPPPPPPLCTGHTSDYVAL